MQTDPISSVRLMLTMSLAGLVSGLVLVAVHLGTAQRIQQNRAAALERAIYQVLPGAETYQTFVTKDGASIVPYEGSVADVHPDLAAFLGLDTQGNPVGYALAGVGAGYMDDIRLLFGYDPQRSVVVGMQVLESKETPGLGDKIIFDPAFVANFEALAVDPEILLVKNGAKTQPHEVDGISGATISSRAVVKILNESLAKWRPRLPVESARSTDPRDRVEGGGS